MNADQRAAVPQEIEKQLWELLLSDTISNSSGSEKGSVARSCPEPT